MNRILKNYTMSWLYNKLSCTICYRHWMSSSIFVHVVRMFVEARCHRNSRNDARRRFITHDSRCLVFLTQFERRPASFCDRSFDESFFTWTHNRYAVRREGPRTLLKLSIWLDYLCTIGGRSAGISYIRQKRKSGSSSLDLVGHCVRISIKSYCWSGEWF